MAPPQPSKPQRPSAATATAVSSKNTIITPTHISFWHGPLSNWHIPAEPVPGSRALALLLERLDADDNKILHPHATQPSTVALSTHAFTCGEQWMMACKAWLFEPSFSPESTLSRILSSSTPKAQKALGRSVENFNDELWTRVSTHVVVAGCIARAEVDDDLRRLYLLNGDRTFVEGSPVDPVWGVRLKFDDPRIRDERNWRGENRLGVCHGIARDFVCRDEEERGRGRGGGAPKEESGSERAA